MRNLGRFLSFWLRTQNPQRFPGLSVVVVTFFDDILDDFHDIFGMCLVPEENQQPFLGVSPFFRQKGQFSLDVKPKHKLLLTKINDFFFEVSPSVKIHISLSTMTRQSTVYTLTQSLSVHQS